MSTASGQWVFHDPYDGDTPHPDQASALREAEAARLAYNADGVESNGVSVRLITALVGTNGEWVNHPPFVAPTTGEAEGPDELRRLAGDLRDRPGDDHLAEAVADELDRIADQLAGARTSIVTCTCGDPANCPRCEGAAMVARIERPLTAAERRDHLAAGQARHETWAASQERAEGMVFQEAWIGPDGQAATPHPMPAPPRVGDTQVSSPQMREENRSSPCTEPQDEHEKVVDIMAALEASIAEAKKARARADGDPDART